MPTPRPLLAALLLAVPALAAEPGKDAAVPLYNGKDLTGWVNVNCAPGTFAARGDEIVTTGEPTGFLRTDRQYENFVLELEWKHVREQGVANSGVFVWGDPLPAVGTPYTRGIEVQVLINYPPVEVATNHGDVFAIHGATCVPDRPHPKGWMRSLPTEQRVKGAGQWNHYKVVANDGVIKLHVNGKEVSGVSKCHPRKGYLALEAEGAECHFRNIRIQELPSTNPKPEDVAEVDRGFKSLFTGLDLTGWKTDDGAWAADGGQLKASGQAPLSTEKEFGPCEVLFDWRVVGAGGQKISFSVAGTAKTVELKDRKPGTWSRAVLAVDSGRGPIVFQPAEGLELMNLFVREAK